MYGGSTGTASSDRDSRHDAKSSEEVDLYADLVGTVINENSESALEAQKRADLAEASVKDLSKKLETVKKLVCL